jgi:hypothetical protein
MYDCSALQSVGDLNFHATCCERGRATRQGVGSFRYAAPLALQSYVNVLP